METAIKMKAADYYGNPSYYSVMPQAIFDALEVGFYDKSLSINL